MKSLICKLLAAAVVATPIVSLAQADGPKTRAQVRAELIELEKAGYTPSGGEDTNYPADIQAAEARVAAQHAAASNCTGVGTDAHGSSQSGHSVSPADVNALYGRP
jgi:hypothetical protein